MSWRHILIRTPNWIGDHVMAMPFYHALRQHYPQSQISLLGPKNLISLDLGVAFDHLIELSPKSFWEQAKQIRHKDFDVAVSLPASLSSALLLFRAKIPHRIGFAEPAAAPFFHKFALWKGREDKKHKTDMFSSLLGLLDKNISVPSILPKPSPEKEKTIVLSPGASIRLREWPFFPELSHLLKSKFPDYKLVIIGGETEKKWKGKLSGTDLIGETTLNDVVNLCKKSSLVIANDSGVAHLAGTLACAPTLVLFGPGDPSYIKPTGPHVYELHTPFLPCRPCESAECAKTYGEKACLDTLPMFTVFEKAQEVLYSLST